MRATASVIALFGALAFAGLLGGCEACGSNRHARAQALDGGVRVQPTYPTYQPNTSAPAVCYVAASQQTMLADPQIFSLCEGAPTPQGPVECYVASQRLGITDAQRVLLCRCAASAEPAECFRMLNTETFLTDDQIEQLCSPTLVRGLSASCIPTSFY